MLFQRAGRGRLLGSVALLAMLAACGTDPVNGPTASDSPDGEAVTLTVYSGRDEELVQEAFDRFTAETGIQVDVRYAGTAELASTLLEEGDASPADLYWAQDAGALGAVARAGLLATLPDDILGLVADGNRDVDGRWVGITGRARTIAYNTDALAADEVPASVLDLTAPEWAGRVGWAPGNGSFQAFVTAMRIELGEAVTRDWLEDMLANGAQEYPSNSTIVEAIGRGEVDLGLVNHYYLFRFLDEDPDFPVAQVFPAGDVGGMLNVAGVGVLASSQQQAAAQQLVEFLLSEEIQGYFSGVREELEYPLRLGVPASPDLPPLDELDPPAIDLGDLDDLAGTLQLLADVGALE
ncbi:MAG: iron ABC transporter substrate-binding protein [Nitriliruptorales bacterium]|nr:iron ABC transporter substrate-binding protein [Nitriliruptorales bacterium]